MTLHRLSYSREYHCWQRMKNCCNNKNLSYYGKYGGSGISYDSRWNDFIKFFEDMGGIPEGLNALGRIDETKDFCRDNCQWIKRNAGRRRLDPKACNPRFIKAKRRASFKNPKSVCLILEKSHYDWIKRQSLELSKQKGEIVEVNQMLRQAIINAFPCPEVCDMFGGIK